MLCIMYSHYMTIINDGAHFEIIIGSGLDSLTVTVPGNTSMGCGTYTAYDDFSLNKDRKLDLDLSASGSVGTGGPATIHLIDNEGKIL